jgi:transcriptional regulator of acetoin/glycerol metabolism
MLDLTGIDVPERPELKHLVTQTARSIENALTLAGPHRLLLRLNWPGRTIGGDDDGLLALDAQGWVCGTNTAARQMLPALATAAGPVHCSELFAQPWEPLFDAAARAAPALCELGLWSGLRLAALPIAQGRQPMGTVATPPLRDLEIAVIRRAVAEAGGNVARAAEALGISRATVYRKLVRRN